MLVYQRVKRGTGARHEDVLAEEERWMLMAPWEKMAESGPRWWVDTLGPTWVNMGKRAKRYGKTMKPKCKRIYKWWVSMVFYT